MPAKRSKYRPFRPTLALRLVWQTYHEHLRAVHREALRATGVRLDATQATSKAGVNTQQARRLERAAKSIVEGVDANLHSIPRLSTAVLLGQDADRLVSEWRHLNVALIRTIGAEHRARIAQVLAEGANLHVAGLVAKLQEAFGLSKARARFWARDQTLKLNAAIQEHRQVSLGIVEYIWHATPDGRTRPAHADLDGTHQHWNAPPDVGGGRRAHPGQDYQCRCYSEPVLPGEEQLLAQPGAVLEAPAAVRPAPAAVRPAPAAVRPELRVPVVGTAEEAARNAFGGFESLEQFWKGISEITPERSEIAQNTFEAVVRKAGFSPRVGARLDTQRGVRAFAELPAAAQAPWEGGIDVRASLVKTLENVSKPTMAEIDRYLQLRAKKALTFEERKWLVGEGAAPLRWNYVAHTMLHETLHLCSPMTYRAYKGVAARLEEGLVESMAGAWGKSLGTGDGVYLEERLAILDTVSEEFDLPRRSPEAERKVFEIAQTMWQAPEAAKNPADYLDIFVRYVGPKNPTKFKYILTKRLDDIK
jgi:SPP1 gp7 family putative phage head morphogenesis protein